MRTVTFFVLGILWNSAIDAQTINTDIFIKNIDLLYESAAKSFKEIKLEQSGNTDDGDVKYHSSRKISGASDVYIKADAENSFTYIAHFESKDLKTAQLHVEDMAVMILEMVSEKGLVRGSGTEMNYEGYRKQTVEFASDNIDIMGKYPSFSIGILKGKTPVTIELVVNEPLWK